MAGDVLPNGYFQITLADGEEREEESIMEEYQTDDSPQGEEEGEGGIELVAFGGCLMVE